ncbi:MAG: HDIG domain-containing protein [Candidatus Nezhaarchaeota archaeon]|nr:HDIG domain-containing protein [Candidatus Nezhaarchaeota archaeon]MCX8142592.1 HDIG domain-containing protein [Candidatus Nezhaarchaeota archaeon]
MLSRDEAFNLVTSKVKDDRYVKHMLAVEAIMRSLAERLGEDVELWGLTGLLHDLDFEETKESPNEHGLVSARLLEGRVPREVLEAIKAHNYENTGVEPREVMAKALIAADAVSGLIVACALVMPNKKLNELRVSTIEKKFRSKDFARGVDRNRIMMCEQIGLTLNEFFQLSLEALKRIAERLGL